MLEPNEEQNLPNCWNELADEHGACSRCGQKVCLREKTINLALGQVEIMYCLKCLGIKERQEPEFVLGKVKRYILSRQCFEKEWIKYKDISQCPKANDCFPGKCFGK